MIAIESSRFEGCDRELSLRGRPPESALVNWAEQRSSEKGFRERGGATTSALLPTPPFFCLFGWLARRGFPFLVWDAACRF